MKVICHCIVICWSAALLASPAFGQHPFQLHQAVSGDYAELPDQTAPNGPEFGYSVDISGSWMAVGAPGTILDAGGSRRGAVFLFRSQDDDWQLVQRIEPPVNNAAGSDARCGHSVALTGSRLAIGCPGAGLLFDPDSENGATLFYNRISADEWEFQSAFVGSEGERCGTDVSVATTPITIPAMATAVSGCPDFNSSRGQVRVYSFDGSDWAFNTTITSSDGGSGDSFGHSVALHRSCTFVPTPSCLTRLAVGAPDKQHGSANLAGSAYVFNGSWTETDVFTHVNPESFAGTLYGIAVDINSTQLVIGSAHGWNVECSNYPRCGMVYHYEFSGGSWSQVSGGGAINDGGNPPGQQQGMGFGRAVALGFDNWVAIGAPFTDGPDGSMGTWQDLGMAELRRGDNGAWGASWSDSRGELRPPGPSVIDRDDSQFGFSLNFGGERWLAAGLPRTPTSGAFGAPPRGAVWIYNVPDGIFSDRFEE